MKKLNYLFFLLALFSLGACNDRVEDTVRYLVNEPVFMSKDEFRAPVKIKTGEKPLTKQGKISYYEGFLFISEPEVGIHIVDNRNPASPKNVGFIELLGNTDIAIRNNVLYADSYVDLVWFDILEPAAPKEMGRKKDIFPAALPATGNLYVNDWQEIEANRTNSIVVGWTVKEKIVPKEKYNGGGWFWEKGDVLNAPMSDGSSVGRNGSMSRFAFYNDYLYSVFNNQMSIFKFTDYEPVKAAEPIYVGREVETIFSYKTNLFMGTPTGMMIYSVANPLVPEYQSMVSHAYGCDPVVVEDDKAYVTVRSGNMCGQNENTLFVVDVSNVKAPKEIASYAMKSPRGLGIDNGILFLCDDGLKIFDASNPQTLIANQIKHFTNMQGFDVIPFNNILMMIAEDGIYQYDYADLKDIKLLSKLPFSK